MYKCCHCEEGEDHHVKDDKGLGGNLARVEENSQNGDTHIHRNNNKKQNSKHDVEQR